MASYTGDANDALRVTQLAKSREQAKALFNKKQSEMNKEVGLKGMDQLFTARSNGSYEDQFKASTVGLVTAEDFKKKRQLLDEMRIIEEKQRLEAKSKAKRKKERERKQSKSSLSFADEVEEEEAEAQAAPESAAAGGSADDEQKQSAEQIKKRPKKDPTADTSFLPDPDRELQLLKMRAELEEEWKREQEKAKSELIEVTYSYWDGSGHRRTIEVAKGARIDQFLEKCRKELCNEFHELRGISSDNLMYIKEDLIIPGHFTFYDLIVTKARGKSGPLFHFDVHDDVRLLADARVEKDESHAGKIITRSYYERNQHIFPVNRWEQFDPNKTWDNYTIC